MRVAAVLSSTESFEPSYCFIQTCVRLSIVAPTRVAVSADALFQSVQDELVLLNIRDQRYFGLDDVGSDMWRLLVQHGDIEAVADRLSAEYEVDRAVARRDLEVLVLKLMEAGLLEAVDTSEPALL